MRRIGGNRVHHRPLLALGTAPLDEPGRTKLAAVGDRAGGHRQLHGRGQHVTLSDAGAERFPRIPGLPEGAPLPGRGRQNPATLRGGIHATEAPEAETREVVVQRVDGHAPREVVEVDVTGLRDRHVQIHLRRMAGTADPQHPVPVATAVAGQPVPARVRHREFLVDELLGETGERHHRLHRGAGRILTLHGAIEQRHIRRVAQGRVVAAADAVDEQIAVEGRGAHHRQHAAGQWIDGDQRPALPGEGAVRGLLQFEVEVQDEIFAGLRIEAFENAQHSPVRVGLHGLVTHLAVQGVFIALLDPGLADVERAAVVRRVDDLRLALVDAADIAEGVREQCAVRVVPLQLRVHHHPGEPVPVDRNARLLFVVQAKAQGHVFVGTAAQHPLAELLDVRRLDHHQLAQLGQGDIQLLHPLDDQRQGVARAIVSQQHAVAIVDQTAFRGQGLQLHAVALRRGTVGLVVENLQRVIARDESRQQKADSDHGHQRTGTVNVLFALRVLESDAGAHQCPAPERSLTRDDTGGRS